jgi:citrate lyase subunit beta/citryl-CoA lyase
MPGANPKALAKARALPADVVIFDLEDSVAPDAKVEARETVRAALGEGGYGQREIIVRVNSLATPWGKADVDSAAASRPAGVLFPKIDGPSDIDSAEAAMNAAGFPREAQIWAMIETPRAILNIEAIAAKAQTSRLSTFVMGTNDLAKELRCAQTPDRAPFLTSLSLTVLAGRAYGVTLIDGVYNDIENTAGFEAICGQGLQLGFDGKTLIHPSQIDICNRVFAPSETEIAHARAVIEAFAALENQGKGVIKVDGKMTELLHLEQARRVVAVADAIAAMGAG